MNEFIDITNNHTILQYFAQIQRVVQNEPQNEYTLVYGPYPYTFADVLNNSKVIVLGKKEERNGLMRVIQKSLTAAGNNITKMRIGQRIPFYFNVETLIATKGGEPDFTYESLMRTFTILFGHESVMQMMCSGQALILVDNVDCFLDLDTAISFFDAISNLVIYYPNCGIVYGAEPKSFRGLLKHVTDNFGFMSYSLT